MVYMQMKIFQKGLLLWIVRYTFMLTFRCFSSWKTRSVNLSQMFLSCSNNSWCEKYVLVNLNQHEFFWTEESLKNKIEQLNFFYHNLKYFYVHKKILNIRQNSMVLIKNGKKNKENISKYENFFFTFFRTHFSEILFLMTFPFL